jgi:Xaa-Pro aminopeptidase
MTQRDQIVSRVRARLSAEGLDAYLAYTPQNNFYCSGYLSWFVGEHWRFHGGNLTLIPADPSVPLALMVPEVEVPPARQTTSIDDVRGYSMWIETRELEVIMTPPENEAAPFQRTSWLDPDEQDAILRELLGDRDLLGSRIGTDLSYIMLHSAERFRQVAPQVRWVDWTAAMFDLRAVKQNFEIECLRRATELQEMAFDTVRVTLREGMTAVDVRNVYTRAVVEAASADSRYAEYTNSWLLPTVGNDGQVSNAALASRLTRGNLVKLDGGVTVGGYKGDGARTFAFGQPQDAAQRLYDTLLAANDLACAELIPGRPVSEAFLAAEWHMQGNGYPQYCRGQYGHSLGLEQFPEEPPYISRDEHRPVEIGMVFAVETPYYGSDIGAITIEDLVLITEDGPEPMHRSPRELVVVD